MIIDNAQIEEERDVDDGTQVGPRRVVVTFVEQRQGDAERMLADIALFREFAGNLVHDRRVRLIPDQRPIPADVEPVPYDFDEALAAVGLEPVPGRIPRNGLRAVRPDPDPTDCPCGRGRFCERCKWKDGYSWDFLASIGKL